MKWMFEILLGAKTLASWPGQIYQLKVEPIGYHQAKIDGQNKQKDE